MAHAFDIASEFLAAYNAHDPARIIALMTADGLQENVAPGRIHRSPEEVIAGLSPFFHSVPDSRWRETQRFVAGDAVVIGYMLTGHLQADIGPFKARNQPIDHAGIHVLRIRDGKVFSAQDFWDAEEFTRKVNLPLDGTGEAAPDRPITASSPAS